MSLDYVHLNISEKRTHIVIFHGLPLGLHSVVCLQAAPGMNMQQLRLQLLGRNIGQRSETGPERAFEILLENCYGRYCPPSFPAPIIPTKLSDTIVAENTFQRFNNSQLPLVLPYARNCLHDYST